MEDQNKVDLPVTLNEIIIDFGDICRFCLTETKSDITVNDKCFPGESGDLEQDSIYNFMTKLKFIKMEAPDTFPSQVCTTCFQLIQLCFDFNQICQKSESLLKDCYINSINQPKGLLNEPETSIKIPTTQEEVNQSQNFNLQGLERTLISVPNVMDEISKIKKTNLELKAKQSINILNSYKKRLNSFSVKVKKPDSQLIITENKNLKAADSSEQLTCSQCLLKFSSVGDLNSHYMESHGETKFRTLFKYQCKNCIKTFRNQENLRRHYKVIHKIEEVPENYLNNKVKQYVPVEAADRKYLCFNCVPFVEFLSQGELMQHFNDSHQDETLKNVQNVYTCAYCSDLTFPNRISANEHLLLVHKLKQDEITINDIKCTSQDPNVFVCMNPAPATAPQCDTQLSSLLEVLNSIVDSLSVAQQGKGFKILCKNCNPPPEFTSANDFAQHIRTHHDESKLLENWASKNGVWTCTECPATYSRKQTLCYHMKEKHKQNLGGMKCPEPDCQESFLTNRQLIQHGISAHHKYFAYFHKVFKKILQPDTEDDSKEKNFECDICQRKYIYKSSLRKHILTTHLGKSMKDSAVCPYCGKTVSSKLNLKSHIEFVHEALFVSCPICKKKINFRTIGKHYKTHKTSSDVPSSKNSFLCNLCGKILKSKRSFEDHQKLHKNIRDELCDICGSGFTTKKFLRLHKKTHEGVERKVFGCDQCDKVFSGRHTLNRHLLTHSGEKNFICEICSKCFYTLQELNRHVRYHKKEYRFDCQLCEMRFLDKSKFRHHMMRHRNVRPHKCQFCEKMFIVKGKMNVHMARKHNFEVRDTKGIWKDPKTYVPLDDLL